MGNYLVKTVGESRKFNVSENGRLLSLAWYLGTPMETLLEIKSY